MPNTPLVQRGLVIEAEEEDEEIAKAIHEWTLKQQAEKEAAEKLEAENQDS